MFYVAVCFVDTAQRQHCPHSKNISLVTCVIATNAETNGKFHYQIVCIKATEYSFNLFSKGIF